MNNDEHELDHDPETCEICKAGREHKAKAEEIAEQLLKPIMTAKVSVSIVCKMLQTVACPCEQCENTLEFAKSLDHSVVPDQCQQILKIAIAAAEARLQYCVEKNAYQRVFGHIAI